MKSLLVAVIALAGIGSAQAESNATAAAAKIGTVYTGDVINGKKVVSSLSRTSRNQTRTTIGA
jgi:hypothetical protein